MCHEVNLGFLRASAKLRPRLNGFLNWTGLEGEAKALVLDFLNQKSVELSLQYRGMVTVISGALEQLVRKLVHEAVVAMCARVASYNELPEKLKAQNIIRTGKALMAVREPPDHLLIEYQTLAKQLATCVNGATAFTLNAEAFTMFISGITPRHLEESLEAIGIAIDWDGFGKNQKFQKMFDSKGAHETGKAVLERLGYFIKLRNRFAHTGTGGNTLSAEEIEAYITFFRAFSIDLARLIGLRI